MALKSIEYLVIFSFILCFALTIAVKNITKSYCSPVRKTISSYSKKSNVTQFGSIAIYLSFTISTILFIKDIYQRLFLIVVSLSFLLGFIDDLIKVKNYNEDGLKSITKLLSSFAIGFISAYYIREKIGLYQNINIVLYYILVIFYFSSFINAVNITDGLDGLVCKTSLAPLFLIIITYNHISHYATLLFTLLVAFLFFNTNQASIFMGDGGSHTVGAIFALMSLLSNPIIITISCLVFFTEELTSFIQIVSLKLFKRKVFLLAPIHHTFQKLGMSEIKIVDRAFILSIIFTFVAIFVKKGGVL